MVWHLIHSDVGPFVERYILFLDVLEYFFGGLLLVACVSDGDSIDLGTQVVLHAVDLLDDIEDTALRRHLFKDGLARALPGDLLILKCHHPLQFVGVDDNLP